MAHTDFETSTNGTHWCMCAKGGDLVFASPRRLNLRVLCKKDRPVREMLDIWPAFPIEIENDWTGTWELGSDNIIAALEHPDRVCYISVANIPSPLGETLSAAIQAPFPELTCLRLWSKVGSVPVLPDSFLGGSAPPSLRTLQLTGILFPAVRTLLLSASDLVELTLWRLPHSAYMSPEAMVACLSPLNRLETFELAFQSPQSRPSQPSPPPDSRVVLPALTDIAFAGMTDYSEDLVARIDTPVLNQLSMSFFLDLVFDIPHFEQFISRAKGLKPSKAAKLLFDPTFIQLELDRPRGPTLGIRCQRIDWQVSSMGLVCGQLSPFLSLVERLELIPRHLRFEPQGEDELESTQFLLLFQPFTAIRGLYVSKRLVPLIAPALQALIGPRVAEVLPNLRDLFLGGPTMFRSVEESMEPFVTARRLSGQPVAVRHWEGWAADR